MVLGSLLAQAFRLSQNVPTKEHVLQFYSDYYVKRTRPSTAKLQDMIRSACSHVSRVYVVVDALDEYLEKLEYKPINEFVQSLLALGDPFKILVTSRILGPIERAFENHSATRLEIRPDEADIRGYIKERIERDLPFAKKYTETIVEKVLHTAEASSVLSSNIMLCILTTTYRFLLAQLHMNSLSRHLNAGEVLEALETLSSNVDQAYDQVMLRIEQQDQYRRNLAMKILCWVAFGFKLPLEALQHALAVAPGRYDLADYLCNEDTLTGVCAGLIRIEPYIDNEVTSIFVDAFNDGKYREVSVQVGGSCIFLDVVCHSFYCFSIKTGVLHTCDNIFRLLHFPPSYNISRFHYCRIFHPNPAR
jgi:hypothetical protein